MIYLLSLLRFKVPGNQIVLATIKKLNFVLFKKTVFGFFRQRIAMGKCETKAIQTDLDIFRHIQEYPLVPLKF